MHLGLVRRVSPDYAPSRRHALAPVGVGRIVPELLVLQQVMDSVHPEPIHSAIEPEAQHLQHGSLHLRIAPVQVRLLLQVSVVVVLAGGQVEGPGGPAELAQPIVRGRAVGLGIAPDVPVPLEALPRRSALKKPWMSVRGVVRYEVEDHLEPARSPRAWASATRRSKSASAPKSRSMSQ